MARYNTALATSTITGAATISSPYQGAFTALTGSAPYTVTLPSPALYPGSNQTFYNATGGNVTLSTPSGSFSGTGGSGSSTLLMYNGNVASITSDGTNYVVISEDGSALVATTGQFSGDVTMNGGGATVSMTPSVLTIAPTATSNINNVAIGSSTRASGAFTTLAANSQVQFTSNITSSSTTTGSLVVTGGIGATGAVYASGFNGPLTGNVTGIIQTAAQPNITSVGALGNLTVNNKIVAGDTASSTNGQTLIEGRYANGAITVLGAMYSSGGAMLGYGVRPSQTGNAFVSSSSISSLARAAYLQNGDTHAFYSAGAQTVAEGSAVSLSQNLTFNGNTLNYNGNTVWHAGNDGSGSGLDADTVDGIQGANVQTYNAEYSTVINADGWYTIAEYGSGRAQGVFYIFDIDSSRHNWVEAHVLWSFGNGGVVTCNSGRHGTSTIRHIRLLYDTTNQTYGGVKVQVYCENWNVGGYGWTLRIRQETNSFSGWGTFSQVTPTLANTVTNFAEYSRAWYVNDQGITSQSGSQSYQAGKRVYKEGDIAMWNGAGTTATLSTIVSNNADWVGFSDRYNSDSTVFEVVGTSPYGIRVKKAGWVYYYYDQDIITSGASGYATIRSAKNGSYLQYQLITNTNGQWDGIITAGAVSVAANDVINFYINAADVTALDPGTWSNCSLIWYGTGG